tara:strand:+ start:386 stop:850 length:465 start_codon:yes stop_codon:yes gene_type:complete
MAGQEANQDFSTYGKFQVMCNHKFDLSGAADSFPLMFNFNEPKVWGNINSAVSFILVRLIVCYTEASSSDSGVLISLGNETNGIQHVSYTSEISKTLNTVIDINQGDGGFNNDLVLNDQAARNLLLITCAGGKTGTGEVVVGAEFSRNWSHGDA